MKSKMSQTEFEKELLTDIIPNMDGNPIDSIIIEKKKRFKLGCHCPQCSGIILYENTYPFPSDFVTANLKPYLEYITELDVLDADDIELCECYKDDNNDDEGYDSSYDSYDEDDNIDDYNDEDSYDDGNDDYLKY